MGAEGLCVKDSVNIFIEDDLENFALRIIELLEDKNLAIAMGEAGRELAATTYDWKKITQKLQSNLNHLCPNIK
jgi:glycosyltransferase involved in cell wall biosynthesis